MRAGEFGRRWKIWVAAAVCVLTTAGVVEAFTANQNILYTTNQGQLKFATGPHGAEVEVYAVGGGGGGQGGNYVQGIGVQSRGTGGGGGGGGAVYARFLSTVDTITFSNITIGGGGGGQSYKSSNAFAGWTGGHKGHNGGNTTVTWLAGSAGTGQTIIAYGGNGGGEPHGDHRGVSGGTGGGTALPYTNFISTNRVDGNRGQHGWGTGCDRNSGGSGAKIEANLNNFANLSFGGGSGGLGARCNEEDGRHGSAAGGAGGGAFGNKRGGNGARGEVRIRIIQRHVITYDAVGGGPIKRDTVLNGQVRARPTTDPVRDGHTFVGWWDAETGGNEYNFNSNVTSTRTLWARWTPTLTFTDAKFDQWPRDGGEVTLSWTFSNPSKLGGGFWIYRRSSTGSWERLNSTVIDTSARSYIDATTLFDVANYGYAVVYRSASSQPGAFLSSLPGDNNNPNSTVRSSIHSRSVETIPRFFEVNARSGKTNGEIDLSFSAHANLADKEYRIFISSRESSDEPWSAPLRSDLFDPQLSSESVFNFNGTGASHSHTHTGLTGCDEYRYTVEFDFFGLRSISSGATKPLNELRYTAPLRATKGEYPNQVRLQWSVEGVKGATEYKISRRTAAAGIAPAGPKVVLEVIESTARTVYWSDDNVLAGVLYEYEIEPNGCIPTLTDIGFASAFGTVSGRVTYGTGTAVAGVNMLLQRNDLQTDENQYHSLRSTEGGQRFEVLMDSAYFNDIYMSEQWTFQFWINPDTGIAARDQEIGFIGNREIHMNWDEPTGKYRVTFNHHPSNPRVEHWLISDPVIPHNRYTHITLKRSGDNVTFYIVIDENPDDIHILKYSAGDVAAPEAMTPANSKISLGHWLRGNIDEVRFWNRALDSAEIHRDYNRYLAGNERGLRGYWTFDEGVEGQAFDMSRVGTVYNGNHATTNTLIPDYRVPDGNYQLALKGITDADGNYQIRGIPYTGEGTSYSIVPTFGVHQFNPTQHLRYIGPQSTVHNGTDFTNISSFIVSGQVFYENSNYPVEGVTISVDGMPATKDGNVIQTDSEGRYAVDVPIGLNYITVSKPGHTFKYNGRFPANEHVKWNFQNPEDGINFVDETTVRIMGRVTGGQIESEKQLGFGLSRANIGEAAVKLMPVNQTFSLDTTAAGRIASAMIGGKPSVTTIKPDPTTGQGTVVEIKTNPETGEFIAELPPVAYNLIGAKTKDFEDDGRGDGYNFAYTKMNFDINAAELFTTEYTDTLGGIHTFAFHDSVIITRYNDPTILVRDLGADEGAFGDKVYRYIDNVDTSKSADIPLYTVDAVTKTVEYALDYPVFTQLTGSYAWEISIFEEYVNSDDEDNPEIDRVPLIGRLVNIDNGLQSLELTTPDDGSEGELTSSAGVVALDSAGKARYRFMTGFPKLAGDHLLAVSINVEQNGKTHFWQNPLESSGDFMGYLLGMVPSDGNNFVTQGPDFVDIVLHDPPGSNSYAYIEEGSSITREITWTTGGLSEFMAGATAHIGLSGSKEAGAVSLNFEIGGSAGAGYSSEWQMNRGNSQIVSTTFNRQISTSGDPDHVGAMADVYIGSSTNRTFSKVRNLALYPAAQASVNNTIGTGGYRLFMKEVTAVGQQFSTMFTYTQGYIVNTLIPNLTQLRNDLITPVPAIPSNMTFGPEQNPHYLTTLSVDDPNFGNPMTYTFFAAPDAPFDKRIDAVSEYNQWIDTWKRTIARSEEYRLGVFSGAGEAVKSNRSFDGGVNVSESVTTSFEGTELYYEIHQHGAYAHFDAGIIIAGLGATAQVNYRNMTTHDTSDNTAKANDLTFGYVLATEGIDDALSVDIYRPLDTAMARLVKDAKGETIRPRNLHGYIFRRRAGQTSCPYEGEERTLFFEPGQHVLNDATFKIEKPDFYINKAKTATAANVPAGREAAFDLELINMSEINRTVTYTLWVEDGTNPDGLIISIDGTPLTSPRRYTVTYGTPLEKIVRVKQSAPDIMDYEGVTLVMGSYCDDEIQSAVTFDVSFTPSSSPITLQASTTIANRRVLDDLDGVVTFTISEYDRTYRNFGLIRLQYRSATSEIWSTIKEFVNDEELYELTPDRDAIGNLYTIAYDYTFRELEPADGEYYFRALAVSRIGVEEVTSSSEEILIVKDVRPPQALGLPSPTNGILSIGDDISITFNEDIQSGMLLPGNFSITGVLNAQEIASPSVGLAFAGSQSAQTELPVFAEGAFTIETWFKRDTSAAGRAGTLFTYGSPDRGLSLGFNADGKAVVRIGSETHVSDKAISNDETWKYVALTYDRANKTVTVFRFEGTTSDSLISSHELRAVPETEGKLTLGNSAAGGSGFSGALAMVSFYNTKRTFAEVSMNKSVTKSGREYGLTGHWPLDEGESRAARDIARSRNMTLGNAEWYIYPSGLAKRTDGTNYFSISTSAYPLHIFADFTLEFWFRSEGAASAGSVLFSANNGYIAVNSSGGLTLHKSNGDVIRSLTTANLMNTQWHHAALSVRRGGNVNVYINGVNTATFPETLLGDFGSANFNFGARHVLGSPYSNYFAGYFDEVRLWNSALSRDGVVLNRNNKLRGDEAGLLAYYPFEEYTFDEYNRAVVTFTNNNIVDVLVRNAARVTALASSSRDTTNLPAVNAAGGTAVGYSNTAVSVKDVRPTVNVPFNFAASNDRIVLSIDPTYFSRVEGAVLDVSVRNVLDMRNNRSNTEKWTAFVRRNALRWESDPVNIVMEEGGSHSFTARITNTGGTQASFAIENLPPWLTVSAGGGILAPQESRDLAFNVRSGVNAGNYEAAVGLTGTNSVTELLQVRLKVTGQRPDWVVNPDDFESSMSIFGQVKIGGVFMENTEDVLGIFAGDMCLGTASPRFVESMNAWFVFATVYGNAEHDNRPLSFKYWEASTGRIYTVRDTARSAINYASRTLAGSLESPVIFTSSGAMEQVISLRRGWNWVSTNVLNSDPAIFNQMKASLSSAGEQIKSQNAFVTRLSGWSGSTPALTEISETRSYLINTNSAHTLILEGRPADPSSTQMTVSPRWNWIGYIPQFSLPVNNALAGLNARVGDIIKGQNGYAMYAGVNQWIGTLEFMQAGSGYMYYNADTTASPKTFTYPSQASRLTKTLARTSTVTPKWSVDYTRYASSMTISAVVLDDGEEMRSDRIEIGAFAGSECRGSAVLRRIENTDQYVGFLMVFGDGNEKITFKVYDHGTGKEHSTNNGTIPFTADAMFGAQIVNGAPVYYAVSIGKESTKGVVIGPNPVSKSAGQAVLFRHGKPVKDATLTVYDASGNAVRKIKVTDNGQAGLARREIGVWDLKNSKGRRVSTGSYVIKGKLVTVDGDEEKISTVIGVR